MSHIPATTTARPGFVINDGAEISVADFAALIGASVDGNDLTFGRRTKAADKLTSVGGSLYVRGYAHALPACFITAGEDIRGYHFSGHKTADGWRIHAGCRDFTPDVALQHWGPGGKSDRPDCLTLVNQIIAEAARRDAGMVP